jgi:pyruvate kinase
MRALIRAGMDVARLNFSHGKAATHREWYARLRQAAELEGVPLAIMQDLSGPKIRIGTFEEGHAYLKTGNPFTLTTRDVPGTKRQVHVPLPELTQLAQGAQRLLLADGMIELKVLEITDTDVLTEIVVGGRLSDKKGLSFSGQPLPLAALTKKDIADIAVGAELGVDYVALSFVRSHSDIADLRSRLDAHGSRAGIIAKLERPEALADLDAILDAADAVMVARGDLALELTAEQVPLAQKRIIRRATLKNRFVITATQMLESMIKATWPTRAEASDVANAVLDGTDAVMLSGETATGDHPVRVVATMQRILSTVEESELNQQPRRREGTVDYSVVERAIAWSAAELQSMTGARAIVAFTNSGKTARSISNSYPGCPVYALSPDELVVRQLNLGRGLKPYAASEVADFDDMREEVDRVLLNHGLVEQSDRLVITAGYPFGAPFKTNLIKVHRVGDPDGQH